MQQPNWADERRAKFLAAFRQLMDGYGVTQVVNATIGYGGDGQFYVLGGTLNMTVTTESDRDHVDAIVDKLYVDHHKKLIDDALDKGDREEFARLTAADVICVDCEEKVTRIKCECGQCGKPMCVRCYEDGHGACTECEYPNSRRYI